MGPHIRDLIIYFPPDYTGSSSRGYIAVYGLVGFRGQGKILLNADPMEQNIEDKMNCLISEKKCVLVLLDCFTKFGGNQYINSSATRYISWALTVKKSYHLSIKLIFLHMEFGNTLQEVMVL